jgi:probable blue pigment (indigoidine) exporter
MKQQGLDVRAALITVLAPISWGTTYVTITELLPQDRPFLVAALRVLPAGIVLASIGAVTARWRPTGRQWAHTAVLALFNFGIFFPLLITAIYRLPGGVAASVGGIQPLLVATLSVLFGVSRPRRRDLVIGVVAALGVALVVIRPTATIDPIGVAAAIGANVSFSVGVVLTKKLPTPANRVGSTGWQLLLSTIVLLPLAAVIEGRPDALSVTNLAGVFYLSLLATGVAFVLWFNGIRRLPTQAPPLLGLAAPITGAVLGWAILNEHLSPVQITGLVITISAIAYGATLGTARAVPVEALATPDTARHRRPSRPAVPTPGSVPRPTDGRDRATQPAVVARTRCGPAQVVSR